MLNLYNQKQMKGLTDYQLDRFRAVNGLIQEIIRRVSDNKVAPMGIQSGTGGRRENAPYTIMFPIHESHVARASIELDKKDAFLIAALEHHYKWINTIEDAGMDIKVRHGLDFQALSIRDKNLLLTIEVKL